MRPREVVERFRAVWLEDRATLIKARGGEDFEVAQRILDSGFSVDIVLRRLCPVLRRKFADCKTLTGAGAYTDEVLRGLVAERTRAANAAAAQARGVQDKEAQAGAMTKRAATKARWDSLAAEGRNAIEKEIRAAYPDHAHHPSIIEALCLEELGRREGV